MTTLDALQAFHRELVALRERIHSAPEVLDNAVLVQIFEGELQKIWAPPARNDKSRAEVKSGMEDRVPRCHGRTADKLQASSPWTAMYTPSTRIFSRTCSC